MSADNTNEAQTAWSFEIAEKLRKVAVDAGCTLRDDYVIEQTARFDEDLGFDSIDEIEFVMALEDTFKVEIDDEEKYRMKTFADVVALLRSKNVDI